MLKKWFLLLLSMSIALTACNSPLYNQTEGNIANVKLKTQAARKISDASGKESPSLLVNKGLYVDTTPISLSHDPAWMKAPIIIRGDQLPFSYYSRTIALGAGTSILTKYQNGLDPALGVTMNYSGTVKGALDLLAVKTGYVYTIQKNKIYWQQFVTRTFDIAFMPGSSDYLLGNTGSAAGANTSQPGAAGAQVSNYVSSDSSDSEYSNLKGTLSVWKDLDVTIRELLSPEGRVMVSESTSSVTVRDRPTNLELVSRFISNFNHNLSKQVLVKVQVLDVRLENDWDFGIDWQLIVSAFHNSPFVVNANYGTPVAIRALSDQRQIANSTIPISVPQFGTQVDPSKVGQVPSYTILLNALNQQGKASIVTEPRVVCLNNQVSVVRIVQQNGYVASIQNTSLAGTGSSTGGTTNVGTVTSQVTPGTVITGLTLYILPKILHDKIYLQVNADLSTNDGFTTSGTGNSQIQLPNITEKHFNQKSVIRSGDTLILAGFRQLTNRAGANQFITSQALGGKAAQQVNTETIVLITPIVLSGGSAA
ncbi:MAG: hypothetical protein H0W64_06225 [Gammaproteobacteria bacterium]|nr:hypothetical protein [Gammaproteobacteria bacterium]